MWLAIRAYHRRRGWLAWHIAAMGRAETLPDLDDLTGEKVTRPAGTRLASVMHNVRLWKATLTRKAEG